MWLLKWLINTWGFFLEQNNGHTDCHIQRKDENAEIRDPETFQKKVKTSTRVQQRKISLYLWSTRMKIYMSS